jgi:ribonucleoside-triphosphate reductase
LYLTPEQVTSKVKDIAQYVAANNAADGSKFDANANVTTKNMATLEAELNKDINIQINRRLMTDKIEELFGVLQAEQYIEDLETHVIYAHDETSLKPYCASVTLYPLLTDGIQGMGGESKPPKHLESFCGSFINLVFALSSQFAGAIATVEFLMYFDKFARKDLGDDYLVTHKQHIDNLLQHVVYSINQPAAARGYQSVFWNISLYDKYYFDSLFGDFVFPDFETPNWEGTKRLQVYFMDWFNKEREDALLTFPVITAALLTEKGDVKDQEFAGMCSQQLAKGSAFFSYLSDSADSLASCCRLRNEMVDNTFSYTLGAGGVSTGSINVITINMNRVEQTEIDLGGLIDDVHKYQVAYRTLVQEYFDANMLPAYSAGFISLEKQFLTIGINGMVEAAEFRGIKPTYNEEYNNFVDEKLKIIFDKNKAAKETYGYMFNTEFVPAENLGIKNAKWDKESGLVVPRDCYNSYFYVVEDSSSLINKFRIHGESFIKHLDGGSALHLNLETYLDASGYRQLYRIAALAGCNYFCTNVKVTCCRDCGHVDKNTHMFCTKCGSTEVDWATRVIGFLKKITSFSAGRKVEEAKRFYHN